MNDNVFAPGNVPDMDDRSSLDLGVLFRRSWDLMMGNPGLYGTAMAGIFIIGMVASLLTLASNLLQGAIDQEDTTYQMLVVGLQFALSLGANFISFLLTVGVVHATLVLLRGEEVSVGDLLLSPGSYLRVLIAAFLAGIITGLGLLMCILPGIYATIVLVFTYQVALDHDEFGPFEVLSTSYTLARGNEWVIVIEFIVLAVLAMLVYCVSCGLATPFMSVFSMIVFTVTYSAAYHAALEANVEF